MGRRGFTLVELLVVVSIIALLIALLLPALARARQLALQVEGASNLHQVGIALHEYANEYGMYPLACTPDWPFADPNFSPTESQLYEPLAGLNALYLSSYGYVNNQPLINPRSGVLPDTLAGLGMMYCPESGSGFQEASQVQPWTVNSQGLIDAFGLAFGLSYWVDLGEDYSPSYDLAALTDPGVEGYLVGIMQNQYGGGFIGRYNSDPLHQPALNVQSNPASLLVTDNAIFNSQTGSQPLTDVWLNGNDCNYVDGTEGALPAGEHELYNDGSVSWVPLSKIKVRFSFYEYGFFGW